MSPTRDVRRGFTLVELLVVISIIGVLMGLLLPAINSARESGRNTQCKSNMKNLGMATLECEARTGHYPTGGWGSLWVGFADGGTGMKQPGGWFYGLLPYLEEGSLHDLTSGVTTDAVMQTDIAREISTTQSIMTCPSRRSVQAWSVAGAPVNMSPYDPINGGQINLASAGTGANTMVRGDYAANAGVRYTTSGNGQGANGEVQYGCILNQGTDYPSTYKTGTGSNATVNTTPFTADTFTGVTYLRSNLGSGNVKDGTSKTYLIGEKFIDRRHYEDGLYLADAGNMYSGMGPDNYRTTFVLPVNTTVSAAGVDPTDPGNPVQTSNNPSTNYGIAMLNDQVDPGVNSANPTSAYGYYSCLFGSAHSGGVNFVFCDGSVKNISVAIDPLTHRYLGERNDGKILDDAMIGQ